MKLDEMSAEGEEDFDFDDDFQRVLALFNERIVRITIVDIMGEMRAERIVEIARKE